MKLTFITNACCIYEAEGFRLLADPWLTEPAFDSWVHDPPITTRPEDVAGVDALYISHIHPDHLDEGTLRVFRRDIPIVTLRDKMSLCARHLKKLGFTDVRAMGDRDQADLGPFRVTMFGPFAGHPHGYDTELGNVVDSALLVEEGRQSVLNCNDNTPTPAAAAQLWQAYGPPTVAQVNYNNAGPYPACFQNLTYAEKKAESARLIARNLEHMVSVAKALGARRVQPFAGAYKLGCGLEHLNDVLGTTSPQHAAYALWMADLRPLVLGEMEAFDLADA